VTYVSLTDADRAEMLETIGVTSVDELFQDVPPGVRFDRALDLGNPLAEQEIVERLEALAARNTAAVEEISFLGAGVYDHYVPAIVDAILQRGEFLTAYTPYQPELSQGVLQALFEYQTLVSRLAGLPIANASLYDGATALVEAGNLAAAATKRTALWVSAGVNPRWREVLRTFAVGTGHSVVDLPLVDGRTSFDLDEGEPPAAVVVASPNHLGCLEETAEARRVATETGALLVVCVDPVAAGLLRTAGSQGADVVVGEGQPLGTPLSFGGPYLGLFACGLEQVRRVPGRLVGESVDVDGRRAYVTTLRTREQDIRREKATSNVCTNQTLIAVACALHLSWLGTTGLRELALRCARGTRFAREALLAIDGVEPLAGAPTLREFAVRLPLDPAVVVERMAEDGFLAGIPLEPEYGRDGLLVAVTERRTRAEIEAYADAMEKVVR
jgi:glycine dehydrogenase subunit 1